MKKYFIFSCIYLLLLASACNEDQEVIDNDPIFNVENTAESLYEETSLNTLADSICSQKQEFNHQLSDKTDDILDTQF